MAPVAECNLASFFTFATSDESSLRSLSTFFGCLASAVHYLHQTKIRHRDIKPENILVKAKRVYLTDFGISLDWENLTRSTTTEDTAKSLIYCAPEVARHEKRNSSSDIWSLGCIYLEIWTVLHGYSVEDLRDYFRARTEVHRFYSNISSFQDWMTNTLSHNPRRRPRLPFIVESWIDAMLQEPYDNRISAGQLYHLVSQFKQREIEPLNPFCGECCIMEEDVYSEHSSDSDPLAISMDTSARVIGQEHPSALDSMVNQAPTYRNQGQWKEAEELEAQVIETGKGVLKEEHPDTLTSTANPGPTYGNQGRLKEAEELSLKVIETRKRVLGEEHPDTLNSIASLVWTRCNQRRWKETVELGVQIMETIKRVLGEEHHSTLSIMSNLALAYSEQGRWKEAEELDI